MKKILWLVIIAGAVATVAALGQPKSDKGVVRGVVEEAARTAIDGVNGRNPSAINRYFASIEEGAQAGGLSETQEPYRAFVGQLPSGMTAQLHSLDIEAVEVHDEAGLARVSYSAHVSLIRGGAAIYTATLRQNVALMKTDRGWLISGGDALQLDDITGTWPVR